MLISKQKITEYIPQRAPFVMIDNLLTASEVAFESTFRVESTNVLMNEDGFLSESALVENVAQTCAAGFGYVDSLKENSEVQLGFIGAVSRLEVSQLPKSGADLTTHVTVLTAFDAIHLVEGIVREGSTNLISCQMKIVLS